MRSFCGLWVRREKWVLSLRGKLILLGLLALAGMAAARNLYPFLAVNRPMPTETLVVDGWLATYELEKAAEEFRRGGYERLLVVRGVYPYESIDHDQGHIGSLTQILARFGVPRDRIHAVLYPGLKKDRTYYSALAVGEWFRENNLALTSLNLATLGPHARRSRLLYRDALGGAVAVGTVALEDPAYEAGTWWRTSEGIREVLFEGVAYVYVRTLFSRPSPDIRLIGPIR